MRVIETVLMVLEPYELRCDEETYVIRGLAVVLILAGSVTSLRDKTPTEAIVKPTKQTVQIPAADGIQMVYVVAGPAAGSIPV
ncbi:hypothetical protein [Alicyclobacillus ferrooxydans]|uniref:Uncharacterized protein n=1 Tax=Alicyclobacillus ferrooxydans TaxID=471514 RepID=A0A0P9CPS3_9BACL|nr:hypothetical protein [Alicyclobacillus ferrooxydans]KPV44827.1 hypothetical protein AN477_05275 [Alicyclobacillus ferrooxydans]